MFFDLINTLDDHIAAMPFAVIHNADDPVGYLIVDHKTDESLLFITDTAYMEYNFSNVTYMMIECNYIESIAQDKGNHATSQFHMSLETLKKFLYHCDLRKTKQIILIHLSDRNSNEEQMIREISGLTGIKTSVANAGDVYELRKDPF
jgi:ribonuclease BN (tRNA processing enzyme)